MLRLTIAERWCFVVVYLVWGEHAEHSALKQVNMLAAGLL